MSFIDHSELASYAHDLGLESVDAFDHFPKFVHIETISGCNARCSMCTVDLWKREKAVLSAALFDRIVGELQQHRDWVAGVILHQDGEPLLDKQLEDKVARLKRAGMRGIGFTTNASLMTERRAAALIAAGVDRVDFSIDGTTSKTFEAIRINLDFASCRDHVLRFIELRNAMNPTLEVRVRMVVQPSNAHEFEAFVDFWRGRLSPGDRVMGKIEHGWKSWRTDLSCMDSLAPHAARVLVDFNAMPCVSPFSSLVVLSDGRVPLCCIDYNADVPMGNLNESSLAEIWCGPTFARVRKQHLEGGRRAMPSCTDCNTMVSGINFFFRGSRHVA